MKILQTLVFVGSLFVALAASAAAAEDTQKLLTEAQTAYLRGDLETARATFEMVKSLDPRNPTAIGYLERIKADQAARGSAGEQEKKFAAVMIAQIEFREATLREALDFLRKKVNETPGNKTPVNFVMQVPDAQTAATKITLNLANVPFTEALRYIGGLSGVTFEYDKYAIVVKAAAGKAAAEAKPAPVN